MRSPAKRDIERDRISELSEPLIHHIFSFLSIKDVVSTSILSTKWRYLWTSTPIIEFRNWRIPPKGINDFMRFVDRVLSYRRDAHSPSIKKFSLYIDYQFKKSRVNEWLSIVLQHKVEEIVLADRKGITFPPCLFTCESLTKLAVTKSSLELPELVNFPKLKILLLNVTLENEHLIQKLLFNSPVLEELSLHGTDWDIPYLCICGPNLKRLVITGSSNRNFDIQISAPNLQSFEYSGFLAKDFVLHNFSTMLTAEIVISRPSPADSRESGELGTLSTKLFSSLSYVKRLRMSSYILKLLSYQDNFPMNLPSYYNLTHLEIMSDKGDLPCWIVGLLLDFLHASPNLESLVFGNGFREYKSNSRDGWSLDLVPRCSLLHLKSVEFHRFSWKQFEKDLVRLFLEYAKALQMVRITISGMSYFSMNPNYKQEVIDDISLFPRGSPECVFHVDYSVI